MDNQRLSSLLFLLGSAALAMPGCDPADDGETSADTDSSDTDASSSSASASNSDSDSNSNSDSNSDSDSDSASSEPTTDSDTMPTTDSDSATTGTDTTPTTSTTTDSGTDTDPGTSDDTGSTSSDTSEGNPVCIDFGNLYAECYGSEEYYAYGVMICEYVLGYAETVSEECLDANLEYLECLNGLDCKALMNKEGPAGCEAQAAAADETCGFK